MSDAVIRSCFHESVRGSFPSSDSDCVHPSLTCVPHVRSEVSNKPHVRGQQRVFCAEVLNGWHLVVCLGDKISHISHHLVLHAIFSDRLISVTAHQTHHDLRFVGDSERDQCRVYIIKQRTSCVIHPLYKYFPYFFG